MTTLPIRTAARTAVVGAAAFGAVAMSALGIIGTLTSKEYDEAKHAEMEVRSLTGHGVAEAIDH